METYYSRHRGEIIEKKKKYRELNREKYNALQRIRRQSVKFREYSWRVESGIKNFTVSDYNKLLELQSHKCAICNKKTKKRLAVDHDHKTGKIRGLLCTSCNHALGLLGDSYENISKFLNYLIK